MYTYTECYCKTNRCIIIICLYYFLYVETLYGELSYGDLSINRLLYYYY